MVSLLIHVKPGSFKNEIIVDEQGNWIIKIREKPIDGAANEYLINYLTKEFKIRRGNVFIDKGTTSKYKKLLLNITPLELEKIIKQYKK